MAGTTSAVPFVTKLANERGHSAAYPIQAYSTDSNSKHTGFEQFHHLQVGEGEQLHIPAGRVHSIATLGPRVCLSLYSTAAFMKGHNGKEVVAKGRTAADKKRAKESTRRYRKAKRQAQDDKAAEDAEEAEKTKKTTKKKKTQA